MAIDEPEGIEKVKEKIRKKKEMSTKGGKAMTGSGVGEMAERAKKELSQLTGLQPSSLIGMSEENGEMILKLEMIEKKSIPDSQDVLGIYEAKLTPEGKIKEFTRTRLRRRCETGLEE